VRWRPCSVSDTLKENADAQAERTVARLSFDPSPEGEALRNYLIWKPLSNAHANH